MQADMDSSSMPQAHPQLTQSGSDDADPHPSDLKDTVSEKIDHERGEEEKEVNNVNQSEEDERNGVNVNRSKEDEAASESRKTSSSVRNTDSRKRTAEAASLETGDQPYKKCLLSMSGSNSLGDSVHMPENSGLTISQLIEHVQTVKNKGLLAEYAGIRMEPHAGTFKHSRVRHNLPRNRYTDVLCYDHSRVKLAPTAEVLGSDYINANLVDGYMQKNAYIAAQGPLPSTFADFWRMVWQNQCQVIVMTTRTVERQRVKCGQYWPGEEQSEEQFEEFVVFNSAVKSFSQYLDTKLLLRNNSTGESREIQHLQFSSWPDHGVPPAPSFLEFLFHVRCVQETATKGLGLSWTGHPLGPPILVHCSAGIGRTGTFITVDISLRRLKDTGTIDVPATVRRIRSQRAFSIQTPDQYVFCHLAVIEHAIRSGMVTDVHSFPLDQCESDSD